MTQRFLITLSSILLLICSSLTTISCGGSKSQGSTGSSALHVPEDTNVLGVVKPQVLFDYARKNLDPLTPVLLKNGVTKDKITQFKELLNDPHYSKIKRFEIVVTSKKETYARLLGNFDSEELGTKLAGLIKELVAVKGSKPARWQNKDGAMEVQGSGDLLVGTIPGLALAKQTKGNLSKGFVASSLKHLDPNAQLLFINTLTPMPAAFLKSMGWSITVTPKAKVKFVLDAPRSQLSQMNGQLKQAQAAWPLLQMQMSKQLDMINPAFKAASKSEKEELITLFGELIANASFDSSDAGILFSTHSNKGGEAFLGVILGIVVPVAIPAFIKYMRRAKTSEAIDELDKIYKGAAVYYMNQRISRAGDKLPCQFPAPTGMIPPVGPGGEHPCCSSKYDSDGDGRCDSRPELWDDSTWSALSFQMSDQHFFAYEFDSSGTLSDARMTATAYGDLDCDGVWSTFQKLAFGDPQAPRSECSIRGAAAFYVENETE